MTGKQRLVIVVESMLGGIRQHVIDVVCGLDKEKYDIYLIYSDLRADDVFFEQINKIKEFATLIKCNEMQREIGFKDIYAYKKLVRIFREIKPDIVHCHSSKAGIVGRMAAKKCGVKIIIYTPNAYAFQSPDISSIKKKIYIIAERFLSRYATDITINVSKGEMSKALEYKIDKENKFTLIYNGIPDKEIPSKAELRNRIGLSEDVKYVGFTGRCAKQKDPFTFLEIAKEVIKQRNDVEFLYIGDGELFEPMKEWVKKEQLQDKIHLLGFRSDASEIVGALDIYLSTALYEGLPYSMIEATRAGVPIIATDCIGNNELIFEGINGSLFNIGDIETGKNKILTQLTNNEIDEIGIRDIFRKEFSVDNMMMKLAVVYKKAQITKSR